MIEVDVVPCLKDNYAYVVRLVGADIAVVVDVSEAGPVLAALERLGCDLVGVLSTHHHHDHVGGNEEVARRYPGLKIYGHVSDKGRIPGQTEFLEHGDEFDVADMHFSVQHIPGHTLGAIAYIVDDAVFTGDTLFGAGCGRLFEGTPAMMYASLNEKLGKLPGETRVYCGHEYTVNNLRFAAHVEPHNPAIKKRAAIAASLREQNKPTVPSTLADEHATNPFMRCDSPEIQAAVAKQLSGERSPIAVLGAIRAMKDAF